MNPLSLPSAFYEGIVCRNTRNLYLQASSLQPCALWRCCDTASSTPLYSDPQTNRQWPFCVTEGSSYSRETSDFSSEIRNQHNMGTMHVLFKVCVYTEGIKTHLLFCALILSLGCFILFFFSVQEKKLIRNLLKYMAKEETVFILKSRDFLSLNWHYCIISVSVSSHKCVGEVKIVSFSRCLTHSLFNLNRRQ